ncbi:MAG: hypothetical protein WC596_04225 [Candidatus Shapirobacteria bacterium]
MHFTCRTFIGKHSPQSWSQYWEKEDSLFGLINLTSDDPASDLVALGHSLIDKINQAFSVSTLSEILSQITSEYQASAVKINLSLVTISDNQLTLLNLGQNQAYLRRGLRIAPLLSASPAVPITGQLAANDQIFLTTEPFFDGFGFDRIKQFLSLGSLQDIEENFLTYLNTLDVQDNLAAVLIQAESDDTGSTLFSPLPVSAPPPPGGPKVSLFSQISKAFPRRQSLYVSSQDLNQTKRHKQQNVILALILLLALGVSSFFGYQKNRASAIESKYQTIKSALQEKLTNAQTVKNLDLESAQNLAKEAQVLLKDLSALKVHPDEVSGFESQISTFLSQTGSKSDFLPEVFYDTGMIKNGPKFNHIFYSNKNIFLFDPGDGRLTSLDENRKIDTISSADGLKNLQFISLNNGKFYGVLDQKVFLITKTSLDPVIELAVDPVSLQSWNQAFYLLSSDAITKFAPNSTGFSKGTPWLQDGQSLPQNPSSLAINGQLWVLSANGQITAYDRGQKAVFKPSQLVDTTGAKNLVTTENSQILAFNDSQNQVYVYQKNGTMLAKYNFNTLSVLSLALNVDKNLLYVLCSDQKIYKISL